MLEAEWPKWNIKLYEFIMIILPVTFIIGVHQSTHLELHGVDESPTLVALVTASLWVVAVGADSFHEAVGEEARTVFTTQLLHCVFNEEIVLVQAPEDVLGYPERKTEDKDGWKILQGWHLKTTDPDAISGHHLIYTACSSLLENDVNSYRRYLTCRACFHCACYIVSQHKVMTPVFLCNPYVQAQELNSPPSLMKKTASSLGPQQTHQKPILSHLNTYSIQTQISWQLAHTHTDRKSHSIHCFHRFWNSSEKQSITLKPFISPPDFSYLSSFLKVII